MRIAVPAETDSAESRVAITPDMVKKYVGLGAEVVVQSGAGTKSGLRDADFEAAGARIVADGVVNDADVVLRVRRPAAA